MTGKGNRTPFDPLPADAAENYARRFLDYTRTVCGGVEASQDNLRGWLELQPGAPRDAHNMLLVWGHVCALQQTAEYLSAAAGG